ncbi:MAG TPA: FKBP-type peptidyl-prolyl cis-trans isomerase [Croceibacterium sp.]|nr:FKBP-type peptidyl-prolyl cis-trans isomerase [Croceibacterium sp.]
MAEVTRVPLKPVNKWSLIMLVVGILIGVALSAAYAYVTVPRVSVSEVRAGTGGNPKPNDVVFVRYTGKLDDGTVFDQSQDLPLPIKGVLPEGTPLPLENMVPGFREAAQQMQKGGKYTVHIPASKAYGETGRMNPQTGEGVPPNADLTFEIEMIDFMSMATAEAKFQQLQQMMMQQQAQQPAPGGTAPAPAPAPGQ